MTLAQGLLAVGAVAFLGEVGISAWLGKPMHRWKDTLAAFSLNAITGATSAVGKAMLLLLYIPLHEHWALWTWTGTALEWAVALLAYDFFAYWFHRWSHVTNLGWAVHVVHHQSEELNLATPMRTAPFRSYLDWPTILPLAILGVPPTVMMVLYLVHVAGQTPIHVRWIPRLGPIEWVFNTPSHHRVHHGCQPGYQDANYGAHFIFWDRMFGTFVPEDKAPHYGVTRPVGGWDPLRSTLVPFAHVWEDARNWHWLHRIMVWVMPPGWSPDDPNPSRPTPVARRADFVLTLHFAAVWHTVLCSLLFVAILATPDLGLAAHLALFGLGVWTMRVAGRALEDRVPDRTSEVTRGVLFATAAVLFPPAGGLALLAVGGITAVVALGSTRPSPSQERASPGPSPIRAPGAQQTPR
jgi:sterol desaturase/sphingolipid hydroxylase (fatty acid hydroxylase superfamily)